MRSSAGGAATLVLEPVKLGAAASRASGPRPQSRESARARAVGTKAGPLQVLVVEDNGGDAFLIEQLLGESRDYKFAVIRAETLTEACARLETNVDVVLLDMHLPDGGGLDALRRVMDVAGSAPTVVLTGNGDAFLARACLQAGADDYIEKDDLTSRALVRSIDYALARARARELGRRLEHADRLAAIGQLAAGVAHEVNNPAAFIRPNTAELTRLIGRARLLVQTDPQRALSVLDEMQTIADDNLDGIDRIIRVVDDLRSFSRNGDPEHLEQVDLPRLCRASSKLVAHRIRPHARFVMDLQATPPVLADGQRLGQVIVNLLVNAVQAVEDAETGDHVITLRTHGVTDFAVISVVDTGAGIAAEDLDRIFAPFHSTKTRDRGTGLGLSISLDLVTRLGGRIEVESEPGRGARFDVYLPHASLPARTRSGRGPGEGPQRPARRVLLVDDEELVLRALARALRRHHQVEVAHSGEQALALLRGGAPFDAILCDVLMPGLDGPATLAKIRQDFPVYRSRLVLLSGVIAPTEAWPAPGLDDVPVLTKPVSLGDLLDTIEVAAQADTTAST